MIHKGTGRTIPKTKREEQAELERQTREFLAEGGKVDVIETHESEFQPTWRAYVHTAMEGVEHEG